jgi:KRAB domain-containing zinc finger protein
VRQHLRSCVDFKRQLRVRMQCLTEEQLLALKSPRKQINFAGNVSTTSGAAKKKQENRRDAISNITCDVPGCNFSSTFEQLQLHKIRLHNPSTDLTCHLCGKVCTLYKSFRSHTKRHQTPTAGVFKCLYTGCDQTVLESEFKEHFKQHNQFNRRSRKPSHECNFCGKFLWSQAYLKHHIDKHFSVQPGKLNCIYHTCKNIFANSADLKKHMAEHVENQYFCSKCSKCCYSRPRLKRHMKSHFSVANDSNINVPNKSADSAFSCPYCGSTFMTLGHFNYHLRKHEMETTGVFTCLFSHCKLICSSAIELQEHSKTHHAEKYTCEVCGKYYKSSVALKSHVLRHFEERTLPCDVPGCSYLGKLKIDIYNHKKHVHDNPGFSCNICGKLLRQMRNLREHLKLHETGTPGVFKCTHCRCKSTTFSSTDELKKHYMLTHNMIKAKAVVKRISCSFPGCAKKFKTLKSLSIHKSFEHDAWAWCCDFCDQHFPCEASLRNHLKSHKTSVPTSEIAPREQPEYVFIIKLTN